MRCIIGIDEVGRGPLAGPVVAAAVALPKGLGLRACPHNFQQKVMRMKGWGKLRDSKKMTANQRGRWFQYFKNHPHIIYSVARVYPSKIDTINISRAANRAAFLAYQRLIADRKMVNRYTQILLDGGLYLKNKRDSTDAYRAKTIVKGDEKHVPIMIASIIAKVTRDRYMVRLAKRYPGYGFEVHKGYGTAKHMSALKKMGPSPAHRLTFLGGVVSIANRMSRANRRLTFLRNRGRL